VVEGKGFRVGEQVGHVVPAGRGSVGPSGRLAEVGRDHQMGDADHASARVAVRGSVRRQLLDEVRRVHGGLLPKLPSRGVLELLVDLDETTGKSQLSLERIAATLDEEHLERVAPDGQADHVHGDREDRVVAGVNHGSDRIGQPDIAQRCGQPAMRALALRATSSRSSP